MTTTEGGRRRRGWIRTCGINGREKGPDQPDQSNNDPPEQGHVLAPTGPAGAIADVGIEQRAQLRADPKPEDQQHKGQERRDEILLHVDHPRMKFPDGIIRRFSFALRERGHTSALP